MPNLPTVLQVLPALVTGGVERGTLDIAEALAATGARALVASAGGPLVAELLRLGGSHRDLPLAAKAPWALWRNARALTALARLEGVGLLHARSRAPAWSTWRAARRMGVPFVTTWHGTYAEDLPGKRLWNSVMARGDRVIAVSRFIAEHILARHPEVAPRVRVIPRGVDPRRFDPVAVSPARVTALRQAWQLPAGAAVLLLPARLSRWKGQAVLIEALARLPETAVAVLTGDGSAAYRAELLRLAAAGGVGARVRLVGQLEDMPAALQSADVVVHASTQAEAFGRTVIEAQAMARPVIASDVGGPRETVEHGVTGWRVPPGDAAALAAAIARVLALPPAALAAHGERARAAVLAHHTTRAMQDATLDVYRELR